MARTWVKLGNIKGKEGYRVPVDHTKHSADDLKTMAEKAEVDPDGTKEELAARLSAKVLFRPLSFPTVTEVNFPVLDENNKPVAEIGLMEAIQTIIGPGGVWAYHADDPPEWVTSDDPLLAEALAAQFGCEVGEPADVEQRFWTSNGPPGVGTTTTKEAK